MALTTNLTAYYKLDEAVGTTFNDSHSTYHGTTTDVVFNVDGKINKGLQTNAATDRIIAPINISGWPEFSASFWIYWTGTSGFRSLIWQGGGYIQLDNVFKVFSTDGVNGGNSDNAIPTSTWTHIVCTMKNGGYGEVYVNGSRQTAGRWVCSNNFAAGDASLDFMTRSGVNATYGTMDEVGIWSRQLTDAEVTSLYNSGAGFAYPFVEATPAASTATLGGGWSSEYNVKRPKEKKEPLSITIMPPLTKQQELDNRVHMINPEIKWGNSNS